MTKQLEKVAFHEAGHVVAHRVLSLPFDIVTIVPDDDYDGRVEGLRTPDIQNKWTEWEEGGEPDAALRDWLERELIALSAGNIAQRRQFPSSRVSGTYNLDGKRYAQRGSDQSQIVRMCHDLFREREVANAYELFIEARARSIVAHYWSEIEAVARALLERKTMTEFDVRKFLCPPGMEGFLPPALDT